MTISTRTTPNRRYCVLLALCLLAACEQESTEPISTPLGEAQPATRERSAEQKFGTAFFDQAWPALSGMNVEEIPLPNVPHASTIWGALGRDDRGHVWFGVSAAGQENSARLYEHDPASREVLERGSVSEAMRTAGLDANGATQHKIHSKIHQADDGFLYFTSMDETNEKAATGTLPKWGSHIWRVDPDTGRWEHVLAAPEGLVALNAVGRWVYALGYWNHVLYQFDTLTGEHRRAVVGSACGHVSRNFLVDLRGHAYVPTLNPVNATVGGDQSCLASDYVASLTELNAKLETVASTTLDGYLRGKRAGASHGIVGLSALGDSTLAFITHGGMLYHVIPLGDQPALVMALGHLYPEGSADVASLFSPDGKDYLAGIGRIANSKPAWLGYNLHTREATAQELDLPPNRGTLLYGSMVRDARGGFYVGGRLRDPSGMVRPMLLRLAARGR